MVGKGVSIAEFSESDWIDTGANPIVAVTLVKRFSDNFISLLVMAIFWLSMSQTEFLETISFELTSSISIGEPSSDYL